MKKLDKTNFFIKIFIILIIAGSIYICINFYIKYTDNNQNKIANDVEENDVNDDIANNQDNQNSDENGVDISVNLHDLLELEVSKKNCKPLFTDTDGIKYFSGTNECVDMNYVWYSGKLWRITAIYPDGALKMVTDNNITSIAFNMGEYTNFYTDEESETRVTELCNAIKNYKEGLPLGELAKYIKPEYLKDTDMFRVVYSTVDNYENDPAISVNLLVSNFSVPNTKVSIFNLPNISIAPLAKISEL